MSASPLKECPYCGCKGTDHSQGCMGVGKPRFVPDHVVPPEAQEVINYLNQCVEQQSGAWPLTWVRVSQHVVDDIIKLLSAPQGQCDSCVRSCTGKAGCIAMSNPVPAATAPSWMKS